MQKLSFLILFVIIFICGLALGMYSKTGSVIRDAILLPTPQPTPLVRYTIDALSQDVIPEVSLSQKEILKTTKEYTSYVFNMNFNPSLNGETKKTSGLLNIPSGSGPFPLIVMIRGYVDQSIYQTGVGTKNGAEYFAQNGFITISPDFLGYAQSDSEAGNIFESRFQTYTTMLALLKGINTSSFTLTSEGKWDGKHIFLWAHSNGGQIALTTLAITGKDYPTVLWAPVSKPFPYSVLYYTDESDDGGSLIRRELAKFESLYDPNKYSFTNYIDRIKAPFQIHQGTADDAIPVEWTQNLVAKLKKAGATVSYFQYPGSDHNLRPAWNDVIARDLEFYKKYSLQ